jgi:hypothetical protein
MNGKLLIPIFIYIALQLFYDLFGVNYNPNMSEYESIICTRWSIFYFNMQYLCWLVLVVLIPKRKGFLNMLPYSVIAIGLITYILMEIKYINSPFDVYYAQVNLFKKYILPIVIISTGLIYYIIKK